jgi:hypothetical protein
VRLSGVTVWEDEYLFLLVQEGGDEITSLHDDLYAGRLSDWSGQRRSCRT